MKTPTQRWAVLKQNVKKKKKMISVLPMVKKMITEKIDEIKLGIMRKVMSNNLKKKRNTPKRISNRTIKSLENNSRIIATKNIISTLKIVTKKPSIVAMPKIVTKPKNVTKPKKLDKLKIVKNYQKNHEYKKHVIMQLKSLFESKKKNYMDYDDEEYRGLRNLKHLFGEVSEDDEDYTNLKELGTLSEMILEIIIILYMKAE